MRKKYKDIICWIIVFVFLFSSVPTLIFADEQKADTVFLNGNIYTVDAKFSKATALAIKGDRLIYVGSDEEAKKYVGKDTKVVDLDGKTVIPGIIEGHMHFPGYGEKLLQIDAFWKAKEDILAAVKADADRLPDGEWIVGRGWNQEVWPGSQFPTKEELDAVAPNNPVALTRTCGHALWANSLAFKIGEITKDTKDPVGGEILRDKDGNPTGILTDTAMEMVRGKVPVYSEERKKEAYIKGQEDLFSFGITSVMDAGSGFTTIKYLKDLYEEKKLDIRLYVMVSSGEDAEAYYKIGPEVGLYDNRLTMNCIKFFSDGSLGARSAWMLDEYSDREGHVGNGRYTDEEFYALIKAAREHGFQVGTHAIGDAAVRQCVDVYEKVLKEMPSIDHRYRIEHFQIATLEDIDRIAKIGIIPAMQSVHATSDKNMAEDRIGPERIKGAYAWRKVIEAGSVISNGSDAPVELVNPYHGLYAAVTRMDREGTPVGGWYPEECMTREEALRSFTIWAAYGQFEENIKGSLEVGKLADFVVIDRDFMTCPANEIKDVQALITVVGGEIVYERTVEEAIVIWEGMPIVSNISPIIDNGRIYVPVKTMAETMDAIFTYNPELGILTVAKGSITLSFDVNDNEADKNNVAIKLVGDEVFISVRYICEKLGYSVSWCRESNTVSITK